MQTEPITKMLYYLQVLCYCETMVVIFTVGHQYAKNTQLQLWQLKTIGLDNMCYCQQRRQKKMVMHSQQQSDRDVILHIILQYHNDNHNYVWLELQLCDHAVINSK